MADVKPQRNATESPGLESAVAAYYGAGDLAERIFAALEAAGKDLDALTPADLAGFDAFHIRGIAGPSRHLAMTRGCEVMGIDLTQEYCRVARSSRRDRIHDRALGGQDRRVGEVLPEGHHDG